MTDCRRLKESSPDDLARALLLAAVDEAAPEDVPAKIARAVGVSLCSASAVVGSKAAAATNATGTSASGTGIAALTKIAIVSGIISGAAVVGVARIAMLGHDRPTAPTASIVPVPTAPMALTAPTVAIDRQVSKNLAPSAGPSAPKQESIPESSETHAHDSNGDLVAHGAPRPTAWAASSGRLKVQSPSRTPSDAVASTLLAPQPEPNVQLEREVAMLDAARDTLAAGQPAPALSILDRYRSEFPEAVLYPESVLLRVRALLAMGQRADAEREAAPLLSKPESRHAEAVRRLLSGKKSPR
jgi:hypothetical protein